MVHIFRDSLWKFSLVGNDKSQATTWIPCVTNSFVCLFFFFSFGGGGGGREGSDVSHVEINKGREERDFTVSGFAKSLYGHPRVLLQSRCFKLNIKLILIF